MTDYVYPGSVEEAVDCLERYGGRAQILAGGTDLLPDMRKGKCAPACLVDITRIPGLKRITQQGELLVVGAAVTFAALKDAPLIRQRVPALAEAAASVGAFPLQTAATWVGNLVQAMPAADGAIVALALQVEAHVVGRQGAAWHPVETLFAGPGRSRIDPTRQLITHLRFRLPGARTGTAWGRLGRRASLVLPILNCAVQLRLEEADGRIASARIALGPVAPCPFRARQAEAFLIGRPATPEVLNEAAQVAQRESDPRSSLLRASREYRLAIIPPLVTQVLSQAAQRAGAAY